MLRSTGQYQTKICFSLQYHLLCKISERTSNRTVMPAYSRLSYCWLYYSMKRKKESSGYFIEFRLLKTKNQPFGWFFVLARFDKKDANELGSSYMTRFISRVSFLFSETSKVYVSSFVCTTISYVPKNPSNAT